MKTLQKINQIKRRERALTRIKKKDEKIVKLKVISTIKQTDANFKAKAITRIP